MKDTITLNKFRDAFRNSERDNFSYQGYEILFDYLERLEEETGIEEEFYPIDIDSTYAEFTLEEVQDNYVGIDTLADLERNTIVLYLPHTDRFIINTDF